MWTERRVAANATGSRLENHRSKSTLAAGYIQYTCSDKSTDVHTCACEVVNVLGTRRGEALSLVSSTRTEPNLPEHWSDQVDPVTQIVYWSRA